MLQQTSFEMIKNSLKSQMFKNDWFGNGFMALGQNSTIIIKGKKLF